MSTDPSSSVPHETIELLRRARGGDGAAAGDLFARYAPRVRGLVAVRMGRSLLDLVDSDDIVQEALAIAFQKLDQFEPHSEGSFICWLAAIAESRVTNAYRAQQTEKRGGGQVQRRADLGMTTLSAVGGADPGPSPSQAFAQGELDPGLERALLGLGDPLRQIVYCKLVLDMEHGEIAEQLGLASADSARAMFHKALARLRQRLEPGADEPTG